MWGIRPEGVRLVHEPQPDDVTGTIEIVEPLGSRQFLFVRVGQHLLTVVTDAEMRSNVGERCYLRFPSRSVHLFDAETRLSLPSHASGARSVLEAAADRR